MIEEDQADSFRDSVSTIDSDGNRVWLFPKRPKGWFYNKRKYVSYLLLGFMFSGPFIKINGNPLLLINIPARKFVFFGQIFWPQDLYIFALGMVIMVLFVIVFTVIFGRIFCGWICPQTIFLEMVFRRIEYWIEGDWLKQKQLKHAPWNMEKIRKKATKHIIFGFISFLISNLFLSYCIGYEKLFEIIKDDPSDHLVGLVSILIFTLIFYLVFSKLREQVCTVICPYGRLQGVLLDKNSLTVAYDYIRGEYRSRFKKGEDREAEAHGDCIDCNQCVNVCPTGIDIRDGIQLECVNCTACIDVCDDIMDKVGKPRGLIRYASMNGISEGTSFTFTPRVVAYSTLLVALMGIMFFLLFTRSDIETTILRTRGTLYQQVTQGHISNIYDISFLIKAMMKSQFNLKS